MCSITLSTVTRTRGPEEPRWDDSNAHVINADPAVQPSVFRKPCARPTDHALQSYRRICRSHSRQVPASSTRQK